MAANEGLSRSLLQPVLMDLDVLTGRADEKVDQLFKQVENMIEYLRLQQLVLNQLQNTLAVRINEMILSGTTAERPAAGVQNRVYYNTSTNSLQFDKGTAWV